jgi:hypothetical protein
MDEKYLLQLIKCTPVSILESINGVEYTMINDIKYRQDLTVIQLTHNQIEALLAIIEGVEKQMENV